MLPQRWIIRFSAGGDFRFCSHRDTMRAIERTIFRAGIPVKFSQGFNPRATISLPCPRPLGVTSLDDPLVLMIDRENGSRELSGDEMIESLGKNCPEGMKFISAAKCPTKPKPQVRNATYRLDLPEERVAISLRIEQLSQSPQWIISRKGKPGRRGIISPAKPIDIKPLVADMSMKDNTLEFTLFFGSGVSARPSEVLDLLQLDVTTNLVKLIRTRVNLEPDDKIYIQSGAIATDGKE